MPLIARSMKQATMLQTINLNPLLHLPTFIGNPYFSVVSPPFPVPSLAASSRRGSSWVPEPETKW